MCTLHLFTLKYKMSKISQTEEVVPEPLYPFVEYNGFEFTPTTTILSKGADRHFRDILEYETRSSDVILCSAMKTGTHWVHEVMSMLLMQTTEYNSLGPWWELNLEVLNHLDDIQHINGPRVLSTHLPISFFPKSHIRNGYKIVYLNRNPKDRYASLKSFFEGKLGMPNWSWNEFFEKFVLNDKLYTGWFHYTKEMTSAVKSGSYNIFPVMYEELILNPKKHYTELAKFLEVPYTEAFIDELVDKCSFQNLKKNKLDVSVTVSSDNKSLFRKGIIGDWKNWFTVAQNEQFDALYEKEMKDYDLKFRYEILAN